MARLTWSSKGHQNRRATIPRCPEGILELRSCALGVDLVRGLKGRIGRAESVGRDVDVVVVVGRDGATIFHVAPALAGTIH